MPFQSEKQRRFLHANHPEIAKRWEREYARGGISNHFRKRFFKGAQADTAEGQALSPGTSASGGLRHTPSGNGGTGGDGPKPHSGPTAAEIAAAAQKKAMEEAQLHAKEMAIQRQHKKKKVDYSKKLQAFGVNEYENLIKPGVVDYQKKHLPDYDDEGFDLQMENLVDHARFLKKMKKQGGVSKDYVVDPYRQTLGEILLGEAHTLPIGLNIEQTDYLDKPRDYDFSKIEGQEAKLTGLALAQKRVLEKKKGMEEFGGATFTSEDEKKLNKLIEMDKEEKVYKMPLLTAAKGGVARKNYFHGGILDINESEEIISDDGNDIELTAYNADFDDPNDLSTGVKTLFQAKDGGRTNYIYGGITHPGGRRGFPGGSGRPGDTGMPEGGSGANYGGPPGGGDKGMTYTAPHVPHYKEEEETKKFAIQEDIRRREEEKYDTKEQREAEVYGIRKWREKEKRVTKLTADFIKNNLKRLNATKYYSEKYGDDIIGTLKKGWEVYKSIPMPTLLGIAKELIAEYELTKEGNALLEQWSDLIGGPPGTNPQAYDDLWLALEKRKSKYRKDDDTGGDGPPSILNPATLEVDEEYAQGRSPYYINNLAQIRAGQEKYADYIEKLERENPLLLQANSGGLANLFRVKNQ